MKKRAAMILLAIFTAAAAAGCGGTPSGENGEPAAGETQEEPGAGETTAEAPAQEPEEPASEASFTEFASFTARDIYGNQLDETVLNGTVLTMINIWGTYCGPCLEEMPDLGDLARDYDPARFQIIGIPIDVMADETTADEEQLSYARELVDATGADYTHLLPEGALLGVLYKIEYIPTTIFVDENGRQVGETLVGSRTRAEWTKIIDGLLTEMEASE